MANQREEMNIQINADTSDASSNILDLAGLFGTVGAGVAAFSVAAVAALGAFAVAVGVTSVNAANDLDKAVKTVGQQTGATGKEMKNFEGIITDLYSQNIGENFQDIANRLAEVKKQTQLSGDELKNFTKNAILFGDTFDKDINETTRAADMLMQQFGISSDEAFNLMTQGIQGGIDKNDDMLDTINEYSGQFKALGFNSEQTFAALQAGAESGAFSVDKVGDAVKEFNIRAKDGSKVSREAFQALGMDADKMFLTFAKGGPNAKKSMEDVINNLISMENQVEQDAAGVALFGSAWEDLGIDVIGTLGNVNNSFDKTVNSANKLNAQEYKTFGDALEGIKRQVIANLLVPLGQLFLPLINKVSNAINNNLPQIINLFKQFANMVGSIWGPIISEAFNNLSNLFNKSGISGTNLINKLRPIFIEMMNLMKQVANTWGIYANTIITTIIPSLLKIIKIIAPTVKQIVLNTIKVLQKLVNLWGIAFIKMKPPLQRFFNFVVPHIRNFMKIVKGIIQVFMGTIKGDWSSAWNGIKNIASGIMDNIKLILTSAAKFAYSAGKNLLDMFKQGMQSKIEGLKNVARNAANVLKNILGFSSPTKEGPGKNSDKWAPNFMDMFINGINGKIPELKLSTEMATKSLKTIVPDMKKSNTKSGGNQVIFNNPNIMNDQMAQLLLNQSSRVLARKGV